MAPKAIPVRNIYYLFLYAWDCFPAGRDAAVGTEDSPDLPNLLGRVLVRSVRQLLRRGLDRSYHEQVEDLHAPRGRILIAPSLAQASQARHSLVCAYDTLIPDVLHNRIIKSTLRLLGSQPEIDPGLAKLLRALWWRFGEVSETSLSAKIFETVQLPRHRRQYELLLRICEMIWDNLQPVAGGSGSGFAALLENEVLMSKVFEAFVRNFLKCEQSIFTVGTEHVPWDVTTSGPGFKRYLPAMRTDVTMRSSSQTIIIDAKFYKEVFQSYRGGSPKIRSSHLYQLLIYISHAQHNELSGRPVSGVLLYPSVDGEELCLGYVLGGYRIKLQTIDLSKPWHHVHKHMLGLVLGSALI